MTPSTPTIPPDPQTTPGLSRYTLRFVGPRIHPRPAHLHAAVGKWMDDAAGSAEDPRLSPHSSPAKLWSAWWLPDPKGGTLEVGIAHAGLAERLRHNADTQGRIKLGGATLALADTPVEPSEEITWSQLVQPPSHKSLTVKFLTPTTFRRGSNTTHPWVAPATILSSLTARWNAVAPQEFAIPTPTAIEKASLWVSSVNGHTEEWRLKIGSDKKTMWVAGFVGEVTYRGDNPDIMGRLGSLLRLGDFLGVGARTEYGFGRMRLVHPRSYEGRC